MKGNLLLLGVFLAFSVVQLVSGRPDFDFDDSTEMESDSEETDDTHTDHHQHHQYVPNPFDDSSKAKSAPDAVATNTNLNTQKSEPQKAAPLGVGTNVSGFNEPCNSTRICNTAKELECIQFNSTCQCNTNYVYVAQTEGCLGIVGTKNARGILSMDCQYDVQCQYGKWGTHSRCEPVTKRCQCLETAIFLDDTCLLNRTVGDICVSDKQCNLTMAGEAVCRLIPDSIGNTKTCVCADGYVWANNFKECLKIPTSKPHNSTCKHDFQCQRSSLGENSRCHDTTLQCQCFDPKYPSKENNSVLYKDVCYPRKEINDTCTSQIECEASLENAVCEEHPAFTTEKICKCPSGKKCDPRKNSAMGIFASEMSRSTLVCVAVASVVLGRMSLGQTNVI